MQICAHMYIVHTSQTNIAEIVKLLGSRYNPGLTSRVSELEIGSNNCPNGAFRSARLQTLSWQYKNSGFIRAVSKISKLNFPLSTVYEEGNDDVTVSCEQLNCAYKNNCNLRVHAKFLHGEMTYSGQHGKRITKCTEDQRGELLCHEWGRCINKVWFVGSFL